MPRGGTEITREQLDVLRTKFDLLQGDRKAYFDTYESTKTTNEQLIKDLRERAKEMRKELSALQKDGTSGGAAGSGTSAGAARTEAQLKQKRKQFDTLKGKSVELQKELAELRDSYRDLELESKKASSEDSPMTRKIRQLENRLDKAMIKFNEAQSIRKTYEQIVRRLKEERVGFDNQIAALERTLAAKEHDYEELLLLSGDASHAKEVALGELERVRTMARQEKERRVKEMREKQMLARARTEMHAISKERERMRRDMMHDIAGEGSGTDGEAALKASLAETELAAERLAEESASTQRKMDVYEEAFRKIKEATGVSDVNEVIQKIVSQDQQRANLKQLTKDNLTKIEALNRELAELKERLDEAKYSGPGGKTGSRKMVDEHEEKLAMSTQRLERAKDKYERTARILINVKAGIDHLTEKLASVRRGEARLVLGSLPPSAALSGTPASVAEASDETIVDVLRQCEETLAEVVARVEDAGPPEAAEESMESTPGGGAGRPSSVAPGGLSGALIASLGITETDIINTRMHNTRIDLAEEDGMPTRGFGGEDSGDEDERFGMDDDACETRESLKKAAKMSLTHNRRGAKKRGARKL